MKNPVEKVPTLNCAENIVRRRLGRKRRGEGFFREYLPKKWAIHNMMKTCLLGFIIAFFFFGASNAFSEERPVFWVPLKDLADFGAVEWGLASFARRTLEEAARANAQLVVFEIDTLGGRVDAMLFIKDLIVRAPVKTVAFVDSKAWSAGVFLALACERIFMVPDGSMGASEPRGGTEDVDKPDPKAVSAIRGQIEALAQLRGRDPLLFAGMVDRNVEIPGVKEKGSLLTLSAYTALEKGAIDGIAQSKEELLEKLGVEGPVVVFGPSWSETLARVLTHPAMVPLLLLLAFGGIFLEIMTPGFGVPGTVGVVSLVLFFGGRYLAGLAGWEPLLLFLLGIALLSLELLVIPGFGVTGFTGIGALLVSLYLVLRTTRVLFPVEALLESFLYLAIFGGVFLFLLFFLPSNPIWRKIGLREKSPARELPGIVSSSEVVPGMKGKAKTVLRPAGIVEIEGKSYDVVTRGEFVEAGKEVVVDEVQGNKIIVRLAKED